MEYWKLHHSPSLSQVWWVTFCKHYRIERTKWLRKYPQTILQVKYRLQIFRPQVKLLAHRWIITYTHTYIHLIYCPILFALLMTPPSSQEERTEWTMIGLQNRFAKDRYEYNHLYTRFFFYMQHYCKQLLAEIWSSKETNHGKCWESDTATGAEW